MGAAAAIPTIGAGIFAIVDKFGRKQYSRNSGEAQEFEQRQARLLEDQQRQLREQEENQKRQLLDQEEKSKKAISDLQDQQRKEMREQEEKSKQALTDLRDQQREEMREVAAKSKREMDAMEENYRRQLSEMEEKARQERVAVQEQYNRTIEVLKRQQEAQLRQVVKDMEQKFQEEKEREAEERRKFREEYPIPLYLNPHINKINVCVTGPSGCGKSTFINILRDVKPGEGGQAKVGVNECTNKPTAYQFPQNHQFFGQVQLWDLPGAGTELFPQETYVQHMGIRWFDACIVVGDTRVREEDVTLMKEMERTKVRFVYVRTKMDHQVEDNLHEQGKSAQETFQEVRESLINRSGIMRPYLIGRKFIRGGDINDFENEDFKALLEDLMVMIANSAKENKKLLKVNNQGSS